MDYGGPNSMEELFQQYDKIVSRAPMPAENLPDTPPWEQTAVEPPIEAAKPVETAQRKDNDYNTYALPLSDEEKTAIKRRKERDQQEEEGLRKMYKAFENPNGASFEQDEKGLDEAYNDSTAPGVAYDSKTHTMYIKGSQTKRDWWDDFTKVPFGATQHAERYQQAEKAMDDLQEQGKSVERVVGHSLGGSVALELQKRRGVPRSRTLGAPVVDLNAFARKSERYRHPLDPVSILDRGAHMRGLKSYPNTYTGFK